LGDIQISEELAGGKWRITAEAHVEASSWIRGRADDVSAVQRDLVKQVIWKIYGDVVRRLRTVVRDLDREIRACHLLPSEMEGILKVQHDLLGLARKLEEGYSVRRCKDAS